MYSVCFIDRMLERNSRAIGIHPSRPITRMTAVSLRPTTLMMAMAARIYGNARNMSVRRMRMPSTIPP